ncbi:MAG: hypothetical protein KGJ63_11090 [Pseudomonadota bacterium]|nr:hypothetical protein [Pseudomonadota bacterium]
MSIERILLAPWIATPRSTRWWVATILVLLVAGDVLCRVFGHAARPWVFSALLLGIGNGLCWAVLIPNSVLLALDARQMGLPGIRRDVVWSLLLYAALTIGVPTLLQLPHGHVLGFGIVQVLVAAIGALYMLLPAYLGLALCLLPVLNSAISRLVVLPGPSDPRFVPWGAAASLLLVLAVAWRLHQLLRGGDVPRSGLRAPNLINLRRSLSMSRADPSTGAAALRARPGWLFVRSTLRGVGPRAPMLSLRVALGGIYLPRTIISRAFESLLVALILTFYGWVVFGIAHFDATANHWLQYALSRRGLPLSSWVCALFCLALVSMATELLTLRWSRVNAELPLLALLPGLGRVGDIKHLLLRTAIQRPASRLGLLCAVGLLVAVHLHAGWSVELAVALLVLVCVSYLVAMALCIFGGRPLPGSGRALLLIGMLVLLSVSAWWPTLQHDWDGRVLPSLADALAAIWSALVLFLFWLGYRGWRGLQQRPHPFLPNG